MSNDEIAQMVETSLGDRPSIVIVKEPPKVTVPTRDYRAKTPAPTTEFDAKLLRRVLRVQTQTGQDGRMRDFLYSRLPRYAGVREIREVKGNIYVTKRTTALQGRTTQVVPCIAAHLDSVHALIPASHFMIEQYDDMLWGWNADAKKPHGIGGDDKVGIFIALQALERLPDIKLVFFRDEEKGCQGSNEADLGFFDDCAFVLQADRRGNDDIVMKANGQSLFNETFKEALGPYMKAGGFSTTVNGASTDVVTLRRRKLDLCTLNASCGYWDPHLSGEYVTMGDVERTLKLFTDVCENLGDTKWIHGPEPTSVVVVSRPASYWVNEEKERPKVWDSVMRVQVESIDRDTYLDGDGVIQPTPVYFRDKYNRWVEYVEKQSAKDLKEEADRLEAMADAYDSDAFDSSGWMGYRHLPVVRDPLPIRCTLCGEFALSCVCDGDDANVTDALTDDETRMVAAALLHSQNNVEIVEEQEEDYILPDEQIIEGIKIGAIVLKPNAPTCPSCDSWMEFVLYDSSSDEWLCIACRTYLGEGE